MVDEKNNKDSDRVLTDEIARLKSDLKKREQQLEIISSVVRKISTSLDFETILPQVAEEARKLIDAETLVVPIINESQTSYTYKAASGKNADTVRNQSFPIRLGMCGWVLNNRKPIFFGEGSKQLMDKSIEWDQSMESSLLVPLIYRGKIIGGLSGLGKKGGGSFTQDDFDSLSLFAGQVSIAIDNSLIVGELQQERDYLSTVLNSIADAVIVVDMNGRVIRMNPVAMSMSGCRPDEVDGVYLPEVFNVIDAHTRRPIENPVKEIMVQGGSIHRSAENILISKNGDEYYISCRASSIKGDNADVIGVILVYHDITEEHRLWEKIKDSEMKHRRLIENLSDEYLFYTHDVDGQFIYVSPSVTRVLGYSVDEFMTHYSTYLTDNPINRKVEQYTRDALAGIKQPGYEVEVYARDGTVHTMQINENPLFDKKGNVIAIEGVAHDITDYRANEIALRRSQKMEAIGQLSGGIAHDFNNQLGVVIGYLDMLKNEFEEDQPQHHWIDVASRASMRCIDLTAQLLSFSRKQGKDKKVVDINDSLNKLKTMVTRSLTSEVEVHYQLTPEASTVLMDEGEFHDALLNLVINARDAMSRGGILSLETSHRIINANDSLMAKGMRAGHYVVLAVTDNGKGMTREVQDKVFEPFFTTKDIRTGTGLGMSMVYGFVERHNGYINLYSEPGIGTTFRIYLPYVEKTDRQESISSSDRDQQVLETGHETILIVDDEPDLLFLANDYLTSLGYTTYTASNASNALEILSDNDDIDMLFSDVVMPGGVNGYELAEKARALKPDLNVLLTSGYTSQKMVSDKLATFSARLLNKPYRKEALAKLVREILDHREPV